MSNGDEHVTIEKHGPVEKHERLPFRYWLLVAMSLVAGLGAGFLIARIIQAKTIATVPIWNGDGEIEMVFLGTDEHEVYTTENSSDLVKPIDPDFCYGVTALNAYYSDPTTGNCGGTGYPITTLLIDWGTSDPGKLLLTHNPEADTLTWKLDSIELCPSSPTQTVPEPTRLPKVMFKPIASHSKLTDSAGKHPCWVDIKKN